MDLAKLPQWLQDLCVRQPGEEVGQHIARFLRALDGISLKNRLQQLRELFLLTEPTWALACERATVRTNCATVLRNVWVGVGCRHPKAVCPYIDYMAVSLLLDIARDQNALISLDQFPDAWQLLDVGWGMHYGLPGTNDDHFETCLEVPDYTTGFAAHAGGGRPDNTITVREPSDIRRHNHTRLLHVIRPDFLVPVSLCARHSKCCSITTTGCTPRWRRCLSCWLARISAT